LTPHREGKGPAAVAGGGHIAGVPPIPATPASVSQCVSFPGRRTARLLRTSSEWNPARLNFMADGRNDRAGHADRR
jgi:hypothetical protein